jgi:hypothetical protein
MAIVRSRGIDGDQIECWSLNPLKKTAEAQFQHERGAHDRYIVSPDGEYLVRVVNWPRLMAQVWSFTSQTVAATLDLKSANGTPELLAFVGPTQFLIQWQHGQSYAMEWLDVKTGQHLPRGSGMLPALPDRNLGGYAISPDGKLVAMPTRADVGQMVLFDPTRGAVVGRRLPINDIDPRYPNQPAGVAFSPDGKKLAVLFERNGNGLLLCWDIPSGKLIAEYTYPGGYGFTAQGRHAHAGRAIEWIGNDAWLLWGQGIFDTATGRLLGEPGLPDVTDQHLINPNTVLLTYPAAPGANHQPGAAQRLAVMHLDLPKLAEAKAAAK